MQKKTKTALWVIIVGILVGLGTLFYFNVRNAVKLENVTLDATLIAQDTVDIELNMLVNNPFFFDFNLRKLQYSVALGNEELVRNAHEINKTIDDTTQLQIPVTINYKKVKSQLQELQAQDSTWLDFNFFVLYELPLLGLQGTTVNNSKKIPVPALITTEIEKIEVNSFGFENIDLAVDMMVDNPTARNLSIDNLVFDVKLNESTLIEGMRWKKVSIQARENTRFTLPITVRTGTIAKEFFDKLTEGDEIKVYLDGQGLLLMEESPIDSLKVRFKTEGAMQL